jgi:hypothetical protein
MILVAGLAVVGLAGIAAAFYFSTRSDGSRDRAVAGARGRGPARSARSARSATSARSARSAEGARSESGRAPDPTGPSGSSTVIDFTGPQRVLEDPEPATTGHRARHEPDDPAATSRSRRRVGWRKGSDVDEELWPAEAFGGVTDEQFWDDLASDKPLATTARTAQPGTAARRRPPNAGPPPDLRPALDRGRADGGHGLGEGPGTQPQPPLGPDGRTAVQLVQPGPQPAAVSPLATQPYPVARPSSIATHAVRAAQQPTESRGRSRPSMDEDPLTSPAYSLRPRGSVGGRAYPSSRRSADLTRERYEAAVRQETQAFSLADAQAAGGGYPDGVPPFRQSGRPSPGGNGGRGETRPDPPRSDGSRCDPLASDPLRSGDGYGGAVPYTAYPYPQQPYGEPTRPRNAPPYGEQPGYGNPPGRASGTGQGGPAGDLQRANGTWGLAQADRNGAGDGSWGSRPAYPPVNGHRGPHDPRGYDRRLTGAP